MPLERCARQSAWGVPTVVPEVLLFYKATAYFGGKDQDHRPHDEADFRALLPLLEDEQHHWLRKAIKAVYPEHPWLSQLSG